MIGRLSQRKAVRRLSGVAAGAKLLARKTRIGMPVFNMVAPEGAAWFRCACTGRGLTGGFDSGANYWRGAGAAFAYNEGAVTPGQSVQIDATDDANARPVDAIIRIGGIIVCRGAGATMDVNGYTRIDGSSANCIGLYARSAGQFGGTGSSSFGMGTGPGGDSDKIDGIGIWGNASNQFSQCPAPGAPGYVENTQRLGPNGPAAAVIEFWSAKR